MAHQWQEGVEWGIQIEKEFEHSTSSLIFLKEFFSGQEMEENNYSLHVGTIFRFIQWDIHREYLAYRKHLKV